MAALLDMGACIDAVEEAFRLHAAGRSLGPAVLSVPAGSGGFHVKAGGLTRGAGFVASKVNANFPDNPRRHGLPLVQGVVVLNDAETGRVLAVLDSIEITIVRTAATSAVAARHLARPDSRRAMIHGCGSQGRAHARALARVLPLVHIAVHDVDGDRARAFAGEVAAELGIDVEVAADPGAASRRADVVATCTPARAPVLGPGDVGPGAFVTAVGADDPSKQELEPRLLAESTVVVDVLDQCLAFGDLRHAVAAGVMAAADVHAELAQVVSGARPGRRSAGERLVFDSTGMALEDAAAAALVYEGALRTGAGRRLEFGR